MAWVCRCPCRKLGNLAPVLCSHYWGVKQRGALERAARGPVFLGEQLFSVPWEGGANWRRQLNRAVWTVPYGLGSARRLGSTRPQWPSHTGGGLTSSQGSVTLRLLQAAVAGALLPPTPS